MGPLTAVLLLLPTIILAQIPTQTPSQQQPQITQAPATSYFPPSDQIPSITTIPTRFSSPLPSSSDAPIWDNIISAADHIFEEVHEHIHLDLRKRQGGVAATAPAQIPTVITQASPTTTYDMNDGVNRVYIQTFAAVPDQFPSPEAGTIGLGTIVGEVGVVKMTSKRAVVPEPTATSGQVLRIRGREVFMP